MSASDVMHAADHHHSVNVTTSGRSKGVGMINVIHALRRCARFVRAAFAMIAAIAIGSPAYGQIFGPLDKDFEEKPWEEQKQLLPGFPKDANLKQIDVGPVTSFRFYVDAESVNVGTDGVVRFALVARSDGGANNVSFEGIRCDTQERKIYSVGRPDGSWVVARSPSWAPMARQFVNPVHTVLYEDYFCPERQIVSSTFEAVEAVKRGGHPRGRTKGR